MPHVSNDFTGRGHERNVHAMRRIAARRAADRRAAQVEYARHSAHHATPHALNALDALREFGVRFARDEDGSVSVALFWPCVAAIAWAAGVVAMLAALRAAPHPGARFGARRR